MIRNQIASAFKSFQIVVIKTHWCWKRPSPIILNPLTMLYYKIIRLEKLGSAKLSINRSKGHKKWRSEISHKALICASVLKALSPIQSKSELKYLCLKKKKKFNIWERESCETEVLREREKNKTDQFLPIWVTAGSSLIILRVMRRHSAPSQK